MNSKVGKLFWKLGIINIGSSIMMKGISFHKSWIKKQNKKAIEVAEYVQLVNGIGLCLLSLRKGTISLISGSLLIGGTVLFPGIIYYQRIYNDYRFRQLVPTGGVLTMAGWIVAILAQIN